MNIKNAKNSDVGQIKDNTADEQVNASSSDVLTTLFDERLRRIQKMRKIQREAVYFLIKLFSVAVALVLLFTLVFGIRRNTDVSMSPALKDGDLVVYYRLVKNYAVSDTVVLSYEGTEQVRRIIAMAGDVVDIKDDGLYINGYRQLESSAVGKTERYDTGVEFPLTVPEDSVFVLADTRENTTDSRVYGAVKISDTMGKVFTIIRRRGI